MQYEDAYIQGASALAELLPAELPADPATRIAVLQDVIPKAQEALGNKGHWEHGDWLSACEGISHVAVRWLEDGVLAKVNADE
jgi:hypothetical protein